MTTILVVDDNPIYRALLVNVLRELGYWLLEAPDGAEGLAIVRAERPDLIVSDMLMPVMDGPQFVRQIRADPSIAHTPVIFCTGTYHEDEALPIARDCAVECVLTKPCDHATLSRAIETLLARGPHAMPESIDRDQRRLLSKRANGRLNTDEQLRL